MIGKGGGVNRTGDEERMTGEGGGSIRLGRQGGRMGMGSVRLGSRP